MPFDNTVALSLIEFIEHLHGTRTGQRGTTYARQGHVESIRLDGEGAIVGEVQGTRSRPYTCYLYLVEDMLAAECSCPVGDDCKHCYAVAITLLGGAYRRNLPWAIENARYVPASWRRHPMPRVLAHLDMEFEAIFGAGLSDSDVGMDDIESPDESGPWWMQFLLATTAHACQDALTEGMEARLHNVPPWFIRDMFFEHLGQIGNKVGVLRAFDAELERIARSQGLRLRPLDPGLTAYLSSDTADELYHEIDRQIAEDRLVDWLEPVTTANSAERARIDLVWLRQPNADGLSVLCFRLLLTSKKLRKSPRHPQAIEQLARDIEAGRRRFPDSEEELVLWLAGRHEIHTGSRYGDNNDKDARATMPVFDTLIWLSLWGTRGLIEWDGGGLCRFDPEPARLTLSTEGNAAKWAVQLPDTQGSEAIPLPEIELLVEENRGYGPRAPSAPAYIRRGDVLHRLETGGMPYDVLVSIVRQPVAPVERLRGTRAGMSLVNRLLRAGTDAANSPFVQAVPARPVVEWHLDDRGVVAVTVRAETAEAARLARNHDGVWGLVTNTDPGQDANGSLVDLGGTETGEENAPPPAAAPVGTHLAIVPRPDDVAPVEEWLEAVVPVAAELATTPDGLAAFAWTLRGAELQRFLILWHERPRGVTYLGNREFRNLITPRQTPAFQLHIEPSGMDFLEVSVEMEEEMDQLSLTEVDTVLAGSEDSLVFLPGGLVYHREDLEAYRKKLDALSNAGIEFAEGQQRIHAIQVIGTAGEELLEIAGHDERLQELAERTRALVESFEGIPSAPVSDDMDQVLRPYQRTGVDFLVWAGKAFGGAMLADDMGLGKTLQVLAALEAFRSEGRTDRPSLVVCPASVAHNWQREAQRFSPGLRVLVLESGKARKKHLEQLSQYDLVVKNYALTRRDIETLQEYDWLMVCVDEAQAIKNPGAAISKAVKSLGAEFRFALTGTPIENRLTDLWSIMDFAVPGCLGRLAVFTERVKAQDTARTFRTLRAQLRPLLMRRLKAEVAPELPPRIEERLDCEMTRGQREAYLAQVKKTRFMLDNTRSEKVTGKSRIQILACLTRLRQICCDPELIGITGQGSGKVNELLRLVGEILDGGHKVLVFSQFAQMLFRLRPMLDEREIPTYLLTGQTTKRQTLIDEFESDESPSVFLISLKAGGTGLNLVSASHVILFDPWWNPAVEAQAIDRTHRIGQDKTVVAFRLVTLGAIEERIMELQERKRALVRNVLEEGAFNQSLTREDFEFLLHT